MFPKYYETKNILFIVFINYLTFDSSFDGIQ